MMIKQQHKALATYHRAKMNTQERLEEMVEDEQGELGSWLILAAGLAIAAGAAVGTLSGWFSDKVDAITSN